MVCGIWLWLELPVNELTFALSVLAITMSQLILLDTDELTKREHRKLDELVRAVPGADDSVAGD